jgi:exodeoxyribonuclease V alpha subunit
VLIVDEASMIDLPMMHRLLQAIPTTATLLLLGDKDQLASVEAGSVLGDVCAVFSAPCVTTLTESWRYKNSPEIGVLAQALNAGAVPDMKNNTYVKQHGLDASKPLQPGWLGSALAAFKRIPFDKNTTAIPDVLAAQKQFQILCALREGPQGVSGINSMIEQSLGKKAGSWYAGKPVMITSNDHARKLYNGDVGLVLPVSDDGQTIEWREGHTLKACFMVDGKVKAISIAQMPVYETCYAITIHKSQGSEYDHVLIVLPADVQAVHSNPVLTKELVYTAVTRAKTRVDIWCGEGVMQAAAAKTTQRMSGLSALLSEHA